MRAARCASVCDTLCVRAGAVCLCLRAATGGLSEPSGLSGRGASQLDRGCDIMDFGRDPPVIRGVIPWV